MHLGITDYVEKFDDVGPSAEVLQDFNLAANLLFLHWFQNLDHAALRECTKTTEGAC